MKFFLLPLSILFSVSLMSAQEVITLTAVGTGTANPHVLSSTSITIQQGDTIELVAASTKNTETVVQFTQGGMTFNEPVFRSHFVTTSSKEVNFNKIVISGPSVVYFGVSSTTPCWATFMVRRAGYASGASAIPLQVGTNFDIILESSSDLINWYPANPGVYSGAEPRRFFRVRMVED